MVASLCFIFFYSLLFSLCSIPLNDYKLLVCDIQQLLVAVTIHSCSSSGSQYFRIIEDLITLLGFMQTSKMRRTQGEDWISENSIHMQNTSALCHQVCSAVLDDIKLSSYQAIKLCCRKKLGCHFIIYNYREKKMKKCNLRNISIFSLNYFLSFSP